MNKNIAILHENFNVSFLLYTPVFSFPSALNYTKKQDCKIRYIYALSMTHQKNRFNQKQIFEDVVFLTRM